MKKLSLRFISALLLHRELLCRLTKRNMASRYKASAIGVGWNILQPLIMMAVYTFVFSTIFKSRWTGMEEAGSLGYALNLFGGLIVFNLVAECIGAAPGLIINNKNYVTKVIFPLELLGASVVGSATTQAITSMIVLIAFKLIAFHYVPMTMVWLPLVWAPLVLGCLAMSWIISALSVFLRDLEQVVPLILTVLMFLSAVFYPVNSLPASVRPLMRMNPLAIVIEQTRQVAIEGRNPNTDYLVFGLIIALVICELSYRGFQHARRGFADVL